MGYSAAILLAAGKGSRYQSGTYKLLAPVQGEPLVKVTLRHILAAKFDEVLVVIGAHAGQMRAVLRDFPVRIVENPDWEKGMSTSLKAGIHALPSDIENVGLFLADQPYLKTETIRALLQAAAENSSQIIAPIIKGKRGNPIIVPGEYLAELAALAAGDSGGRKLLEKYGFFPLPVDDEGILHDVDRIEDLVNHDENKFLENYG